MDNGQILETAKTKKAKGMDLNDKENELYNNYINTLKIYPNTYKNDAYGLLSELYDELQNFDPEQTDKENQISIYFKIDSAINDVIFFAKTTELKPEKVNEIIRIGKFLNQIKVNLNKVNEADINEPKDAFNFGLDGNDTPKKFIEHAELIEAKILKGIEAAEPVEVAQSKELTKDELFKERNNLIREVKIEDVYNFFSVLINKPNRKGECYLSENKLLIFIKSTFIDKEPIQQTFDVGFSRDKKDVRSVFKKFQDYCYGLEYNKKNVKEKYFDIMYNAFKGFNKNTDFNKWHETNNKLPILKSPKGK
ncbi:hypothetical protein [Psychroserpens damuponensis]|uniref:hypothetical protein n=1 Tax=Psychroserpens damuponensis TaxID=943936 RepID=UPI0005915539|nr:hypothetical protein [Psychroserpens damuponensis]